MTKEVHAMTAETTTDQEVLTPASRPIARMLPTA